MGVIGMMAMYCIQNWKLCYIAWHHLSLQSIALGLRKQFISGLLDRTVIDITQQRCPPLADKSTRHQLHPCMSQVQTCLCFADRLFISSVAKFHILNLQYAKFPTQPAYHWCFPDDRVTSSHILQRARDKVRLRLPQWEPQSTGEDRDFFRPCGVEWPTVVHSSNIQE